MTIYAVIECDFCGKKAQASIDEVEERVVHNDQWHVIDCSPNEDQSHACSDCFATESDGGN